MNRGMGIKNKLYCLWNISRRRNIDPVWNNIGWDATQNINITSTSIFSIHPLHPIIGLLTPIYVAAADWTQLKNIYYLDCVVDIQFWDDVLENSVRIVGIDSHLEKTQWWYWIIIISNGITARPITPIPTIHINKSNH